MRLHFVLILAIITVCTGARAEDAPGEQYGAKRKEFMVEEHKAFIIHPTEAEVGAKKPWVWYAPTFIGQHPDPSHEWMAKQLLDAGFAIAGVEVGESYGSPAGRAIYTRFHEQITRDEELDPKACLLPQSRGGLMLLNWAVEHPELVHCIAGIYTVCNLESYPGVDRAAPAYELTSQELQHRLAEYNPIERLKPLAEAKVPVLFIHGDSDTVVPLENNAGLLVERYQKLGGPAQLIVVKGKGHEVCPEFFQSEDFVKFLLDRR